MNSLEKAVVGTLSYSDIFSFPLKEEEIHKRLIGKKCSPPELNKTLDSLINSLSIHRVDGYYFLKGRNRIVKLRKTREIISSNKLRRANQLSSIISIFPSVRAVFLTGTLAVNNASKDDDIDLMIVTRSNTLWTTRLFLTLLLDLLNFRRKPDSKNPNNLLCLNIYVDTSSLTIPPAERSLYSAYELIQAKPLIDKDNISSLILTSNLWIKNYLPNISFSSTPQIKSKPAFNPLENFSYKLQLLYMSKKITNEKVSLNRAFFHPRTLSPDIMTKFIKLTKENDL